MRGDDFCTPAGGLSLLSPSVLFLHRAAALLAGAPVLGIDCEWQPAMREEESNSRAPVAILQVCTCGFTASLRCGSRLVGKMSHKLQL